MSNKIESIKAKLRNYSRKFGKTHQYTLTRYFQERILYRLSKSAYREHFFLKGGALIYAINKEQSRPTLDIDFLVNQIDSDKDVLKAIFRTICEVESDDCVTFDIDGILVEELKKKTKYAGYSIRINAYLGNIPQKLKIDLGFGDKITNGPIDMKYPTILAMEPPILLAYSIESLIAEKFHAMIDLAELNSRMKDFYDVYRIIESKQYNSKVLKGAIENTFKVRQTKRSEKHSFFEESFANDSDRIRLWKRFLTRSNLDTGLVFSDVMKVIVEEMKPIYNDLA